MEQWHDLFAAVAGSAAALTGLIFVGVSISLKTILSIPKLPNRALISMILLLSILILSILFLVPNQSVQTVGTEVLITGILEWLFVSRIDMNILRKQERKYNFLYIYNIVMNQAAILPFIICGIAILCNGEVGIYWMVPGIIFSLVKAILDAWVLLVEIHR